MPSLRSLAWKPSLKFLNFPFPRVNIFSLLQDCHSTCLHFYQSTCQIQLGLWLFVPLSPEKTPALRAPGFTLFVSGIIYIDGSIMCSKELLGNTAECLQNLRHQGKNSTLVRDSKHELYFIQFQVHQLTHMMGIQQ